MGSAGKFSSRDAMTAMHESGWTVSYEGEFSLKYQDQGLEKIFEIEDNVDNDHNLYTILFLDDQDFIQYKWGSHDMVELTQRIHDALTYLNNKDEEEPFGKVILEIAQSR